jgi:hypothetical protein
MDDKLLKLFLDSGVSVADFNQQYHLGRVFLRKVALRTGKLRDYQEAISRGRHYSLSKRIGRGKFSPISEEVKRKAMSEYLSSNLTTKEISRKYGFNERRLRLWFIHENRLHEFETKAKCNIHKYSSQPMPMVSKIKITGIKSISYHGGIKVEIRNGIISGILRKYPEHPHATVDGYIPDHRLVMEKILGRLLKKGEIVHHINLDPTDNRSKNLLLVDSDSLHILLHSYLQYALVQLLNETDLRRITLDLLEMARKNGPKRKRKGRKEDVA